MQNALYQGFSAAAVRQLSDVVWSLDPEVAALNPPKVARVRGALVILDGHHRIAAARKAGQPIEVHYHDTDATKYGKPLHELYKL